MVLSVSLSFLKTFCFFLITKRIFNFPLQNSYEKAIPLYQLPFCCCAFDISSQMYLVTSLSNKHIKIFFLCYIIRNLQKNLNIIWQPPISRQTTSSLAKSQFHQFWKSRIPPAPLYEWGRDSNCKCMLWLIAWIWRVIWYPGGIHT